MYTSALRRNLSYHADVDDYTVEFDGIAVY